MIPAKQNSSMIGSNGNVVGYGSSGLGLTQPNEPNVMDGQLLPFDMNQNTTESNMALIRDDGFESKSDSENNNIEGASGDDQDHNLNQRPKKKRYHRHTQHQIEEMEAFFKECPHPDDKQRKELSRQLGLVPMQVKFWFQNKRTQMKTQHERHANSQLRNENEKLRVENIRYKEAIGNASCPNCGDPTAISDIPFDEHHLRLENARLREEIDRMSGIAAKYVGKPVMNFPLLQSPITQRSLDLAGPFSGQSSNGGEIYGCDLFSSVSGVNENHKSMVIERAITAMEELIRMAQVGEPLWMQGLDGATSFFSEDEYMRTFRGIGPTPMGLKCEASRETGVVIMSPINLVKIFMDVNQWCTVFSGIVSRAMTLDVLSIGVAGNYNGALQVMTAEFQVPTPLVPTRECYFARYCKEINDGIWAVVDVSLDNLHPIQFVRCRRRPSGCLIQEMPNGYAKVTWVEHVEVDDRGVHNIYKPLVNSGLAFGAKRWVATLDRQCERIASSMATNANNMLLSVEGKKSMLKLAERMVMSFFPGVSASAGQSWTILSGSGSDDVRIMSRINVDDPGRPPGIVLSATTSFWLPVPPTRVFDFLRNDHTRMEWDILSNTGHVQEMSHIANGREPGNYVSLMRVSNPNSSTSTVLILQESITDSTASYVIYAPIDISAMNVLIAGGDTDYVAILPSGFAILPDGPPARGSDIGEAGSGGSLLTIGFQILIDPNPAAKLSLGSVATVNNLINCTIQRIKANMLGEIA